MEGFFYLFIFLITILVLIIAGIKREKKISYLALSIWIVIIGIEILVFVTKPFYTKKILDKEDYYGEYIIDRNYFSGRQSDWQYNSFRFEIKKNDSIYFHQTNGRSIIKTYKGKISSRTIFKSARLKISMEKPSIHILDTNPTTYREVWDFYLVFDSPKYSNMFFRKGKWKEIKD